jgi:CubicO group peptidase (beta-lactamase class C family)
MGGISGHAGLFATAADVARVGVSLLGRGRGVLSPATVAAALRPTGLSPDGTRGLGVELLRDGGFGGTQVAAGAFGHTGFTGTSLFCDPRRDLCVVLLTNRVHPTRVNGRIAGVRRALHDLVTAACDR